MYQTTNLLIFFNVRSIAADQFQRTHPLPLVAPPRVDMNVGGLGSTSYMNIHKLKREVDSLKQRQQEIQLFTQVI